MAKEALLKVISTEKEASELIKNSKEEARLILEKAEKKSKTLLEESYVRAMVEVDNLKKEARDSMKEELDQIDSMSKKRCESIVNIEQQRFDEAKKFLIERIVR